MTKTIVHGIDTDDFRFRHTKEALAQAIYYAQAQAFRVDEVHWTAATHERREECRALAHGVLKPPTRTEPQKPVVMVGLVKRFTTGLRGITNSHLIGVIEPTRAEVRE